MGLFSDGELDSIMVNAVTLVVRSDGVKHMMGCWVGFQVF